MQNLDHLIGTRPIKNLACPACAPTHDGKGHRYSTSHLRYHKFRCTNPGCGCEWRIDYQQRGDEPGHWLYRSIGFSSARGVANA